MAEPTPRQTGESPERPAPRPLLLGLSLLGTLFSTLCCVGIAPLVALVSAVGLGALLIFSVLFPLLVAAVMFGGYALWRSHGRHRSPYPLLLHAVGGLFLVVLIGNAIHDGPWVWIAMAAVTAAVIWNLRLEKVYWSRTPEVTFNTNG